MNFSERTKHSLSTLGLVAGILALVNIISVRSFVRLDLTRSHAYSLSKVSKKYMRELEDPLTVKAFFTKQLPPPYNTNARYVRDLLDDYRAYSRGRFNYQFIDPADDASMAQEARSLGVYEIQLTAIQKDQFQQKNGYMGLALVYRGKKEVIPLIQETSGLEYQISSAIKKLVQKETKVVGVTQGYGEAGLFEALGGFQQLLAKNYEVMPVDLSAGGIPDRVQSLVVAGPTSTLPDDKLYALDQFVRSGKNMLMLAPMVKADVRTSMQGRPVQSGLTRLLQAWGVKLEPNLVYDLQCQRITVSQRGMGFVMQNIVPYPPFPLVNQLNANHIVNKNIESITLPFVSSLTLEEGTLKNNRLQAEVVAKSSPRAWAQKGFFMLSPQYIGMPQPGDLKQFDLVVAVSGIFPSAFSPDKLPATSKKDQPLPAWVDAPKPARVLVVGSADFLGSDFMESRGGNMQLPQFVMNMVDWVAQDSDLIEIRSKGTAPASLAQVPDVSRYAVKYFNLVGLPLLTVLFGLYMWRRQANRRLRISALFKEAHS